MHLRIVEQGCIGLGHFGVELPIDTGSQTESSWLKEGICIGYATLVPLARCVVHLHAHKHVSLHQGLAMHQWAKVSVSWLLDLHLLVRSVTALLLVLPCVAESFKTTFLVLDKLRTVEGLTLATKRRQVHGIVDIIDLMEAFTSAIFEHLSGT